ncbi:hypothetical protein [Streptomyces cuspidosporus]|uniref:hypothetical protein n=1 Tax=Streptomyces cuspidosporus TaxID=66882 RepID=UPI0031FD905F
MAAVRRDGEAAGAVGVRGVGDDLLGERAAVAQVAEQRVRGAVEVRARQVR